MYARHAIVQAYQDSRHEGSSVGRGEKAKASKDEGDKGHKEDLRSTSHAHGQQHRGSWGSENITMHQLPSKVLLNILLQEGGREGEEGERERERERGREKGEEVHFNNCYSNQLVTPT